MASHSEAASHGTPHTADSPVRRGGGTGGGAGGGDGGDGGVGVELLGRRLNKRFLELTGEAMKLDQKFVSSAYSDTADEGWWADQLQKLLQVEGEVLFSNELLKQAFTLDYVHGSPLVLEESIFVPYLHSKGLILSVDEVSSGATGIEKSGGIMSYVLGYLQPKSTLSFKPTTNFVHLGRVGEIQDALIAAVGSKSRSDRVFHMSTFATEFGLSTRTLSALLPLLVNRGVVSTWEAHSTKVSSMETWVLVHSASEQADPSLRTITEDDRSATALFYTRQWITEVDARRIENEASLDKLRKEAVSLKKAGNTEGALRAMKRTGPIKRSNAQLQTIQLNLESMIEEMTSARINRGVLEVMRSGASSLQAQNQRMEDMDVEGVMDFVSEQISDAKSLGDEFADTTILAGDDAEFERELAEMMGSPAPAPTPTHTPAPTPATVIAETAPIDTPSSLVSPAAGLSPSAAPALNFSTPSPLPSRPPVVPTPVTPDDQDELMAMLAALNVGPLDSPASVPPTVSTSEAEVREDRQKLAADQ